MDLSYFFGASRSGWEPKGATVIQDATTHNLDD
jgi:hypothetical protein